MTPYGQGRGRVQTDSAGNEVYSPRDYFSNVGFGMVTGHTRIAQHGRNPDIDAGPAVVWDGMGLYPWLTAATALEVVSTSASDAAAGTGARSVRIEGLDANYNALIQTVALNGLTAVAIPTPIFRINRVIIASAGTGKVNAGDISVRDVVGGTVRGMILTGRGLGMQSQYTVPAGYRLLVNETTFCINRPTTTRDATIAAYVSFPTSGTYILGDDFTVNGHAFTHVQYPGYGLPEKTDFGMRCLYVSATNTDLTASWVGILKLMTAG